MSPATVTTSLISPPLQPPSEVHVINPYQTPQPLPAVAPPVRVVSTWLALVAWLYPLVLFASLYGTWLFAGLLLGHLPRPWLDDPKSISGALALPYSLTGFLLVGFPAAAITGLIFVLWEPHRPWHRRIQRGLLFVTIWSATISFLHWDPLRVIDWYFD